MPDPTSVFQEMQEIQETQTFLDAYFDEEEEHPFFIPIGPCFSYISSISHPGLVLRFSDLQCIHTSSNKSSDL